MEKRYYYKYVGDFCIMGVCAPEEGKKEETENYKNIQWNKQKPLYRDNRRLKCESRERSMMS